MIIEGERQISRSRIERDRQTLSQSERTNINLSVTREIEEDITKRQIRV